MIKLEDFHTDTYWYSDNIAIDIVTSDIMYIAYIFDINEHVKHEMFAILREKMSYNEFVKHVEDAAKGYLE